jgi:hypothetical protein
LRQELFSGLKVTPADLRVQMSFLCIAERFEERKVIENLVLRKKKDRI